MKIKLASAVLITAISAATAALSASEPNTSHPETLNVRGPGDFLDALSGNTISAGFNDLDSSSALNTLDLDHRSGALSSKKQSVQRPDTSDSASASVRPVTFGDSILSAKRTQTARKLTDEEQAGLLGSTAAARPERAHIVKSSSTPAGHYYARFKDGSVFLIPDVGRDKGVRNLKAVDPLDKHEVDRLDKQHKRNDPDWVARERQRVGKYYRKVNQSASVEPLESQTAQQGVATRAGLPDEKGFFRVTFSDGQALLVPPKMPQIKIKRNYGTLNMQHQGERDIMERREHRREYRRKLEQTRPNTLEPAPHSAQSRLVQDSGSSGSHHNPSQGSDAPWSPTFDGLEDIVSLH